MTWRQPSNHQGPVTGITWTVASLVAVLLLACFSWLPTTGSGKQVQDTATDRPPSDEQVSESGSDMQLPADGSLYREGTEFSDTFGKFVITGDRVEYQPANGGDPLIVLENLALQRVQNEVFKLGGTVRWEVKGELTEYQGHNFLLIRRAVIASSYNQE